MSRHLRIVEPSAQPPVWLVPPVAPLAARGPYRLTEAGFLTDEEIAAMERGPVCSCGGNDTCLSCAMRILMGEGA